MPAKKRSGGSGGRGMRIRAGPRRSESDVSDNDDIPPPDNLMKASVPVELSRWERARRCCTTLKGCCSLSAVRQKCGLLFTLDKLYDLFNLLIAVVDISSDVLIARQYYHDGHMSYFYACIIILIIASIAYVVHFAIMFLPDNWPGWKVCLVCVLMFPLGQLLPLIMWLYSSGYVPVIGDVLKWIGFDPKRFDDAAPRPRPPPSRPRRSGIQARSRVGQGEGEDRPAEPEIIPDENADDPLRVYIFDKLFQHQSFILESLVESAPQSVLQMLAITSTGVVTPLNVFSLSMSIVSMCSKVIALAWHVDRVVFAFGALCCTIDLIGTFSVFSWLFFIAIEPGTGPLAAAAAASALPTVLADGTPVLLQNLTSAIIANSTGGSGVPVPPFPALPDGSIPLEPLYTIFWMPNRPLNWFAYLFVWKHTLIVMAALASFVLFVAQRFKNECLDRHGNQPPNFWHREGRCQRWTDLLIATLLAAFGICVSPAVLLAMEMIKFSLVPLSVRAWNSVDSNGLFWVELFDWLDVNGRFNRKQTELQLARKLHVINRLMASEALHWYLPQSMTRMQSLPYQDVRAHHERLWKLAKSETLTGSDSEQETEDDSSEYPSTTDQKTDIGSTRTGSGGSGGADRVWGRNETRIMAELNPGYTQAERHQLSITFRAVDLDGRYMLFPGEVRAQRIMKETSTPPVPTRLSCAKLCSLSVWGLKRTVKVLTAKQTWRDIWEGVKPAVRHYVAEGKRLLRTTPFEFFGLMAMHFAIGGAFYSLFLPIFMFVHSFRLVGWGGIPLLQW